MAALVSGSRRRILRLIAEKPRSASEVSEALRMHRTTVRHHLEVLLQARLIHEIPAVANGRGRPARRYEIASETVVAGYPARQYQMLAEMAIDALLRSTDPETAQRLLREVGRERGQQMIQYIQGDDKVLPWTPERFAQAFVLGAVPETGLTVEVVSHDNHHVRFRFRPCPFQEVAMKHTELVCEHLDTGFHQGLIEAMGAPIATSRYSCIAHGSNFCDYEFRWTVEVVPAADSGREGEAHK
jgi:predicted ArsR family transcriptional regulator